MKHLGVTQTQQALAVNDAATPFLRWAGGKRSLKGIILDSLPEDFLPTENRYFEPFIGGGAVMFATENLIPGQNVIINDYNRELILVYRAIRDDVEKLIVDLKTYIGKNSREGYNAERARHMTLTDSEVPAWFIFMNKTGFNGIWRVNSTGQYNVPWGQLKNPLIVDEGTLRAASRRLQNVTIRQGSYMDAIKDAQAGDVVYFDPPYLPLTATSFAKYTKENFTLDSHRQLAKTITEMTNRSVRVILSNAFTNIPDPQSDSGENLTTSIFGQSLKLRELQVARSVGAAPHTRVKAKEILGFNYDIPPIMDATLVDVAGSNFPPASTKNPPTLSRILLPHQNETSLFLQQVDA